MGWTLLGTCDPLLTHSPSKAPTAKLTKAPKAKPASPGGGGFGLPDLPSLPECNSLMPLPSVLELIPRDSCVAFVIPLLCKVVPRLSEANNYFVTV